LKQHEWQAADTGASAVVEGVRRVGHPPLAARDEAFCSWEPPPLPCPHAERRAGRWARVGGVGPIVRGRAGAGQCVVAFSGDQRQQEESREEEKPSLTVPPICRRLVRVRLFRLGRRRGNGWGRGHYVGALLGERREEAVGWRRLGFGLAQGNEGGWQFGVLVGPPALGLF
jgi:hypothetical protein